MGTNEYTLVQFKEIHPHQLRIGEETAEASITVLSVGIVGRGDTIGRLHVPLITTFDPPAAVERVGQLGVQEDAGELGVGDFYARI